MSRRVLLLVVCVVAMLMLVACRRSQSTGPSISRSEAKELLMRINQTLSTDDRVAIEQYIEQSGLQGVRQSPTGLFYLIEGDTSGQRAALNSVVEYRYSITLLDSTECYAPAEPKQIMVGKGGVESGVEEALQLMHVGQRAMLIIPPHLAHGLAGDGQQIPPRAIIVYRIELLSVTVH